jgi:hypothetical protein
VELTMNDFAGVYVPEFVVFDGLQIELAAIERGD